MAASQRGIKKFKEWTDLLDEQGWSQEDKNFLIDFWWKHHDDDGNLYPPGQVRRDGDSNEGKT